MLCPEFFYLLHRIPKHRGKNKKTKLWKIFCDFTHKKCHRTELLTSWSLSCGLSCSASSSLPLSSPLNCFTCLLFTFPHFGVLSASSSSYHFQYFVWLWLPVVLVFCVVLCFFMVCPLDLFACFCTDTRFWSLTPGYYSYFYKPFPSTYSM